MRKELTLNDLNGMYSYGNAVPLSPEENRHVVRKNFAKPVIIKNGKEILVYLFTAQQRRFFIRRNTTFLTIQECAEVTQIDNEFFYGEERVSNVYYRKKSKTDQPDLVPLSALWLARVNGWSSVRYKGETITISPFIPRPVFTNFNFLSANQQQPNCLSSDLITQSFGHNPPVFTTLTEDDWEIFMALQEGNQGASRSSFELETPQQQYTLFPRRKAYLGSGISLEKSPKTENTKQNERFYGGEEPPAKRKALGFFGNSPQTTPTMNLINTLAQQSGSQFAGSTFSFETENRSSMGIFGNPQMPQVNPINAPTQNKSDSVGSIFSEDYRF